MKKCILNYFLLLSMPLVFSGSLYGQSIVGVVLNNTTKAPIAQAEIILKDKDNNIVDRVISGQDGTYSYEVKTPQSVQIILAQAKGHNAGEVSIGSLEQATVNFSLDLISYIQPASLGGQTQDKSEISSPDKAKVNYDLYYEHNSSYLNQQNMTQVNQVLDYMRNNPGVTLVIGAHAFSGGNLKYNQWLTERRLHRIADYLKAQGIASTRVFVKVDQANSLQGDSQREFRKVTMGLW